MLDIQKKGSPQLHLEYTKRFGPIFKVFGPNANKPAVVVTSPELVRQVLRLNSNRPQFPNMNTSKSSQAFEKENILAARGEHWRSLRGAWTPTFVTGSLENYAPSMNKSAKVFVERLAEHVDSKESVEIWRLIGDLTLDVIGGCAFGVDLNTQKPPADISSEDAQAAQQLREDCAQFFRGFGGLSSSYFLAMIIVPELSWLIRTVATAFPDKNLARNQECRTRLVARTTALVSGHRAAVAQEAAAGSGPVPPKGADHGLPNGNTAHPGPKAAPPSARPAIHDLKKGVAPGSFLDVLTRSKDRAGQPFTDTCIAAQCFLMVLAGYETTANTLAFTMYNMSRYPACQAKLAAEANAFSGDPTFQDLSQFPYSDACLRETLRMYPPGAVALREASRDMMLGGYKIRQGQQLTASFFPMHRDEAFWKDPETFIPERWIDGNPDTVPEEKRKLGWAAFGDGARQCPGYRFSLEESRLFLIHVFRAYTFRLAPGQEPLAIHNPLTLSPKHGVHLYVHKRG